MEIQFAPNVDLMPVFNSQVEVKNDAENIENGICYVKAGGDGPPIHTHPNQEEKFIVLKGNLEVYKKNKWHKLSAGEEIIIPKNTAHSFRSRDAKDCYFEYRMTPRGNFTGMIQTFEKLMQSGDLKSTSDLKSLIYLAMIFDKHSKEIKSVSPPHFVLTGMSKIGKLLGYRV